MKNLAKIISVCLIVIIIAISFFLYFQKQKSLDDNSVVKIGAIIFSTGPQAALGAEILAALRISLGEINANGGIEGKKIELLVEDSKDSPKEAITEFQKLNDMNVVSIICTGDVVTYTLAPMAGKAEVPFIAVAAAGTDIPLLSDYAFRAWSPEHVMASAIARYARDVKQVKRIAILEINNEYGDVSTHFFTKEFSQKGEVITIEKYNISDTDMRNQIAKCLKLSPDAFFVTGFGDGFGICINQIRESGFKGIIFSNSSMSFKYFQDQTFHAHNGVIFPTTLFPYVIEDQCVKSFCENFKLKSGMEASYAAAFGYESLQLIVKAALSGGVTRAGIKNGLSHLKNIKSLLGNISYEENGEIDIPVVIMEMKNHEPVLIL